MNNSLGNELLTFTRVSASATFPFPSSFFISVSLASFSSTAEMNRMMLQQNDQERRLLPKINQTTSKWADNSGCITGEVS